MTENKRGFRGAESLAEEAVTRDAIEPFLSARAYSDLRDHRTQTGTVFP